MKESLILILNRERNEAEKKAEDAKRNQDMVNLLTNKKYLELLEKLIKTIQDHG